MAEAADHNARPAADGSVQVTGTPAVTIAIPTFNRSASVEHVVEDLLPYLEAGAIAVLVVDDGSVDGTYERLLPYVTRGVRVLRNETNRGYARTFVRALRESRTEWVLLTADDDRIDLARLPELTRWLQAEDPDFVSTRTEFASGDTVVRRGRVVSGPIATGDFYAVASHAPGLIYRVSEACASLRLLEEELERCSDAAIVYPQVIVAMQLIVGARAMWWEGTLVYEGEALPSGIIDQAGRAYQDPGARLSQTLAFDHLLRRMVSAAPTAIARRRAQAFLRFNERRIYRAVRTEVLHQHQDATQQVLDMAIGRYFIRSSTRALLSRIPGIRSVRRRR